MNRRAKCSSKLTASVVAVPIDRPDCGDYEIPVNGSVSENVNDLLNGNSGEIRGMEILSIKIK